MVQWLALLPHFNYVELNPSLDLSVFTCSLIARVVLRSQDVQKAYRNLPERKVKITVIGAPIVFVALLIKFLTL